MPGASGFMVYSGMKKRVNVSFTEAHSELWDDLKQVTAKNRAERLRILACVGLSALNRSSIAPTVNPEQKQKGERQEGTATGILADPARKKLRERLKASVSGS
jgi:hypothetical protein